MTGSQGLPYDECRRERRRTAPGERTGPWPAYALPPFHPGARGAGRRGLPAPVPAPAPRVRRRSGRWAVDGAAVSGVLIALCVAALLMATFLAAVRVRG
ncbi:hypothetical protein [Streptomyces sp. NPDC096012]|uniref:hypothetical protein n=1 Tax=Streptomyces sp. NPDC096012 TaxID=3155684 RepID=UPI00336A1B1F